MTWDVGAVRTLNRFLRALGLFVGASLAALIASSAFAKPKAPPVKSNAMAPRSSVDQSRNSSVTERTTACVGRFDYKLPSGWRVVDRSAAINQVEIEAVQQGDPQKTELWSTQLHQLRAQSPPAGVRSRIVSEFNLATNTPAVWYYTSTESTEAVSLMAQRNFGSHAVRVRRHANVGGESLAQQLVGGLLDAYRPNERRGFCVGSGSFLSEPALNEEALVSLSWSNDSKVTASVSTFVRREPDPVHPLDKGSVPATSPTSAVQPRSADFIGESKLVQMSDSDEGVVKAVWYFPGLPSDPLHPQVKIEVVGDMANVQEVKRAFQKIVNSIDLRN